MLNAPSKFASLVGGVLLVLTLGMSDSEVRADAPSMWSDSELQLIKSLWIESLPELPPDPSNHVCDDPAAVDLGHRLFFETRLSPNGEVACVTCHDPALKFTDGKTVAEGQGKTARNTLTIVGVAYSPWLFWDGRKDSQWSQALGPLESLVEHGTTRTEVARLVAGDSEIRRAYEQVFGSLPEGIANIDLPVRASPLSDQQARDTWESMPPADREMVDRIFPTSERRSLPMSAGSCLAPPGSTNMSRG